MNGDPQSVAEARHRADQARARLLGTFDELIGVFKPLQQRLEPSHLARDAWDAAKEKGADLAEEAVDAVRARPFAATGVAAAITMFLAREPLIDLATSLVGSVSNKRKTRKSRKPAAKPTPTEAS